MFKARNYDRFSWSPTSFMEKESTEAINIAFNTPVPELDPIVWDSHPYPTPKLPS